MIGQSKVVLISIAAVATVAVVSPAFAQSFSASPYGTGNVLSFTYQPIAPQKNKIGVGQTGTVTPWSRKPARLV